MRVSKTKWFTRYARRERIKDSSLAEAIARRARNHRWRSRERAHQAAGRAARARPVGWVPDAHRLPLRRLRGASLRLRQEPRENIEDDELVSLREIAAAWLRADGAALERQVRVGLAMEVDDDQGTDEA
jgi:hypothetical protein